MERDGDSDTDYGWCTEDNPQRISKGTGRLGNKRMSGDYSNNSSVAIGQKTKKGTRVSSGK